MKNLLDNPKEPIQFFRKRGEKFEPMKNSNDKEIFACGECGTHPHVFDSAKKCCKQNYCKCGEKIQRYITLCDLCSSQNRVSKAEVVEYNGGPLSLELDAVYFSDLDELYEYLECNFDSKDDWPEWVHPCDKNEFFMDIQNLLESALDEHHEDAYDHLIDVEELDKFVDGWVKKQKLVSWESNWNKKIRVCDELFEREK